MILCLVLLNNVKGAESMPLPINFTGLFHLKNGKYDNWKAVRQSNKMLINVSLPRD